MHNLKLRLLFFRAALLSLSMSVFVLCNGCAATRTMVSKRNLNVQTKSSASIFLNPVPDRKKVVYVQVKNTSDKPMFNLRTALSQNLINKRYKITHHLDHAHYLLQVNILRVGKSNPSANEKYLSDGFGGVVTGAIAGVALTDSSGGGVAGGLVGGLVSTVVNSVVKDVTYAVVTDVQISERTKNAINEESRNLLKQGTSGETMQSAHQKSHWHRYRTRILSTAEKANLKFKEALPELKKGLVLSIAGLF